MKKNRIVYIIGLFFLICLFVIIYLLNYINSLESQINDRDALITDIQKKKNDNCFNDTVGMAKEKSTSITINRETVSVNELIRYANQLYKSASMLEDSLSFYKAYFEIMSKQYGGTFKVESINNKIRYAYTGRDVQKMDSIINSKIDDMISIQKQNQELNLKLSMYQKAINKYNIKFEDYKDDGKYITYIIKASQVDSALILLPYFRDRLIYNSKKGHWEIKKGLFR